ncbi:DUF916 domain-containing protein [Microbacterium protaetiae]|uniref:DUF916 domain-containing protein n=1 Tax=Microbacterium protaetiae TaxID=2509458 RepID=A0A4P6EA27_9MICO|nr:DUF916 domain-containing protein [Microbacterium protaetiae]QAY58982.1 DUF916 domain-containing protein [Microbacterium protaetiae]
MPIRIRSLFSVLGVAVVSTSLLTVASLLAPPAAQAADDDVTWSVRTASNQLGAERTDFTYTLNPGGTIDDGLVVANRGSTPLDLSVYVADGFTTDGGQFDVLAAGEQSVGLGDWVQANVDHITVKAGTTVTVGFTLTVPKNATPGDYAGGIVTSLTQPDDAFGVNVDRRLGIRMNLRVGGDLAPALAVEDVQVAWDGGLNPFIGGDADVSYTLHNTGNTVLSAKDAASVAGPFGWIAKSAGEIDVLPALLPGETWTQHVRVTGVAPLVLLTGTATVTPIVTDASGTTSALSPVTGSATGWAVPWVLLVVLVLVVAAIVLAPRMVRWRRRTRRAREDARVQAAVAQALAHADTAAE